MPKLQMLLLLLLLLLVLLLLHLLLQHFHLICYLPIWLHPLNSILPLLIPIVSPPTAACPPPIPVDHPVFPPPRSLPTHPLLSLHFLSYLLQLPFLFRLFLLSPFISSSSSSSTSTTISSSSFSCLEIFSRHEFVPEEKLINISSGFTPSLLN